MYIRRKVFSVALDEYGEERYFSTNEIINEDAYLDELMYSDYDYDYDERMYAYIAQADREEAAKVGKRIGELKKLEKSGGLNKKQVKELQDLQKKYEGFKAGGRKEVSQSGRQLTAQQKRMHGQINARGKQAERAAQAAREAAAAKKAGSIKGRMGNAAKSVGNYVKAHPYKAAGIGLAGAGVVGGTVYGVNKLRNRNKD